MSMDFIKILGDIINEQFNTQAGQVGVNAGQQAASGGSSSVPSYDWESGDKLHSPLKNPGKCNNYGQIRNIGTPKERTHYACDDSKPDADTRLEAPHDGVLSGFRQPGKCGNGVKIEGEDENGKKLKTIFCHLRNIEAPDGPINKGDLVGYSGGEKNEPGAGNSSGSHLHWEFYVDGTPTNPYTYN